TVSRWGRLPYSFSFSIFSVPFGFSFCWSSQSRLPFSMSMVTDVSSRRCCISTMIPLNENGRMPSSGYCSLVPHGELLGFNPIRVLRLLGLLSQRLRGRLWRLRLCALLHDFRNRVVVPLDATGNNPQTQSDCRPVGTLR